MKPRHIFLKEREVIENNNNNKQSNLIFDAKPIFLKKKWGGGYKKQ
jgi:hypothetical protein